MRRKILISVVTILTSVLNVKSQDTLVSAFFGLDNAQGVLQLAPKKV